jgi:hypothetical protein
MCKSLRRMLQRFDPPNAVRLAIFTNLSGNDRHQPGEHHDIKDLDPTPRANIEQWRFTPSLLDPNSFAFTTFANQLPGYYTPTPGGSNTLYHTQAGDLHTPGFSMGLGTPLSMPHSEVSFHTDQASTGPMQSFNPQAMATDGFQNPNPFAFHHHQQHPQEQPHLQPQQQQQEHQTFSPDQFNHDPTHFGSFQLHHHDETKLDEYGDVEMHEQSPIGPFSQSLELPTRREAVLPPMEKYVFNPKTLVGAVAIAGSDLVNSFRYHLTLNAPTAMIKHPEEIPVTYLNKGQAYAISIVDTKPSQLGGATPRYRTYIRVSFEDEQQRLRPAQCWQLWKEGRGTNEAHHRGGRLQAVEFVDPNQTGSLDQSSRPRVELESTSFDCFAVTWSPVPNGPPECSVSVRFNFLSTDFSHSKGVKGIPVRLCAKTQIVSENVPGSPVTNDAEICYCKVKLFRDHGAERKLSNDVAHVKKTIDKLKQQITQVESGIKDFGKRKRSGSGSKASIASRPGKVQKHKRTWSMSSASDTGNRGSQEEDLHAKLADLQDMFTSTRPASVLFLKSDELDDPDLHPVQLTGDLPDLPKGDSTDASLWEKQSTNTSSMVSPSPSQQSLHSERGGSSAFQNPVPFPHQSSSDWQNISQTATADLHPETRHFSPLDTNLNAQKVDTGTLTGWIEALGVDCDYQPPVERVIKPGKHQRSLFPSKC